MSLKQKLALLAGIAVFSIPISVKGLDLDYKLMHSVGEVKKIKITITKVHEESYSGNNITPYKIKDRIVIERIFKNGNKVIDEDGNADGSVDNSKIERILSDESRKVEEDYDADGIIDNCQIISEHMSADGSKLIGYDTDMDGKPNVYDVRMEQIIEDGKRIEFERLDADKKIKYRGVELIWKDGRSIEFDWDLDGEWDHKKEEQILPNGNKLIKLYFGSEGKTWYSMLVSEQVIKLGFY